MTEPGGGISCHFLAANAVPCPSGSARALPCSSVATARFQSPTDAMRLSDKPQYQLSRNQPCQESQWRLLILPQGRAKLLTCFFRDPLDELSNSSLLLFAITLPLLNPIPQPGSQRVAASSQPSSLLSKREKEGKNNLPKILTFQAFYMVGRNFSRHEKSMIACVEQLAPTPQISLRLISVVAKACLCTTPLCLQFVEGRILQCSDH